MTPWTWRKNMIELPQHPKYNTLEKKNGSASYGRRRLLQTLREFELWEQAIAFCQSPYLETPGLPAARTCKNIAIARLRGRNCGQI